MAEKSGTFEEIIGKIVDAFDFVGNDQLTQVLQYVEQDPDKAYLLVQLMDHITLRELITISGVFICAFTFMLLRYLVKIKELSTKVKIEQLRRATP